MKKSIVFIMALAICLFLVACEKTTDVSQNEVVLSTIGTEVTKVPEETTTPEETTNQEVVQPPVPKWEKDYMVDAFGDATKDVVFKVAVDGTYSDETTSDANLKVNIYFEPTYKRFFIRLFENGDQKVTYSKNDKMTMQIKTYLGIKDSEVSGSAPDGDVFINFSGSVAMINYLYTNKLDVPAILKIGSSTYKFTFPCNEFSIVESYIFAKK